MEENHRHINNIISSNHNNIGFLLESSLDAIWAIDKDFKIIFFNNAFKEAIKRIFNYEIKTGDSIFNFFKDINDHKWRKISERVLTGHSLKRVFTIKSASGKILSILFRIFPLRNGKDEIYGLVIIGRNITKERKKEKVLKHHLMEQYLINEVFKALFNPKNFDDSVKKVLEIIGSHTSMSTVYVYEDYYDEKYSHLCYSWQGEGCAIKLYNEIKYDNFPGLKDTMIENSILIYNEYVADNRGIRDFFEPLSAKSAILFPMMIKGHYIGFIGLQENNSTRLFTVSEIDILRIFANILANALIQKYTEEKLTYASTHDPLTGLYNRAYFDAELERIKKGRGFPVSFIVADLNGLKKVNDTLGHKKGDELLIKAADVLMRIFRKEDCVARIGGDEFSVVLPRTDEKKMYQIIERIREVEKEVNLLGGVEVSFAIGGATALSEKDIYNCLIVADKKMYENKRFIKSGTK